MISSEILVDKRLPTLISLNNNSLLIIIRTGTPSAPTRVRSSWVSELNSNNLRVSLKTKRRDQSQLIASTIIRRRMRRRRIFITMRRTKMTIRIKIRTVIIMKKTARGRRHRQLITPVKYLINHHLTLLLLLM